MELRSIIGKDLFGRSVIYTAYESIDASNVVKVLGKAMATHNLNRERISYLYQYVKGDQPILGRTKVVRSEICHKTVENHALEVVEFISGYFLGEPVTYVQRGEKKSSAKKIELLNDYMFFEDKASQDKDLATWMAICGVGYRMILPDKSVSVDDKDESPFEIDTLDPRDAFIVYNSGFGNRPVMGVYLVRQLNSKGVEEEIACVYTKDRYYEVFGNKILVDLPHAIGDIPIIEYDLNMLRMGAFEPAIPLLDAINDVTANRLDGLESFVQSFLKFKNCDIDDEALSALSRKGAIAIKSVNGLDADVDTISQELNQQQTQTLVDYLYGQVLIICGLPQISARGSKSSSDTGNATILRDGWQQTESRAKDTELIFKKSEKRFLKIALKIIRDVRDFDLSLSEVECKFTRRQHDNLLVKTQSLLHMLEAGLAPEVAIATCGLFNDPMDVVAQSKSYLEKWVYEPTEESVIASGYLGNLKKMDHREGRQMNDGKQDTDEISTAREDIQVKN